MRRRRLCRARRRRLTAYTAAAAAGRPTPVGQFLPSCSCVEQQVMRFHGHGDRRSTRYVCADVCCYRLLSLTSQDSYPSLNREQAGALVVHVRRRRPPRRPRWWMEMAMWVEVR
uniref:Uncharacterized protein n=1 Tax=Arundo donax TaxID=35708 RepID=A0A0A8ZME1_ARUDO